MADQDPHSENEDEDDLGDERRMTGFAQRLRKRFGKAVDPHISLEPSPPSGEIRPAPDEDSSTGSKGESLSKKRLERLGHMTPAEFRYQFREEVGRGGMGAVLKVWDRDLGRHLAMKVVTGRGTSAGGDSPADHSKLTRFLEEAQITGQLDHPGVVPVHELGMDARGRCFFTMRLVKGRDLKAVFGAIHSEELVADPDLASWTRNRALSSVYRVCETMAFAHSKGVVHRDLKPANIMVGRFGETYVMDWGLAKIQGRDDTRNLRLRTEDHASVSYVRTDRGQEAEQDPDSPLITMDGDVVGTPAYMAPEQAKGQLDKVGPQSDIYSMGAILYHLLTGSAPYSEPDEKLTPKVVLMKVLGGPPARIHKLRKDVPVELSAICEKAMAYSRRNRYATMLELAEDLSAFLEGRVVRAYQTGSVAEFKKWVERNKPFAAVISVALIIVVSTLGRISYLKSQANTTLNAKNNELVEAKLAAEDNARRAGENELLATAAKEEALANARASLRSGYISNIQAATSRLRLDETRSAMDFLDQAAGEFAGWEWRHLKLATDTSYKTWASGVEGTQRVAFSPDGRWIASVSDNLLRSIELRSADSGEVIHKLAGHSQTVTALAFSPDSRYVASGSRDRSVRIWDVATGASSVLRNVGSVEDLAFAPYGNRLGIATKGVAPKNGQLLIYALGSAIGAKMPEEPESSFDSEGGASTAIAFGPRGRRLLAGSSEGRIQLWDLISQTKVTTVDCGLSQVLSLSVAASGGLFAATTEDGVLRIVNSDRGEVVAQRSLGMTVANDCAFLQDGRLMLACGDGVMRLFNLDDASLTSVHGHLTSVTSVAVSGLGATMVSGSIDGNLKVWSCYSFLPTTLFTGHQANVRDLAFDPSGRTLATAADDGMIWLWDATSGEVHHVLAGHDEYVRTLAYSHDGEWLASGSGDETIRLWGATTGGIFAVWEGHDKWISDLEFSPDDRYLASSSGDGTVRIWEVEEERCIAVLEGHSTWVHCLAWNPAGTRLISGDGSGEVIEWDPFRGEELRRYPVSTAGIRDLLYGPKGETFIAGGLDSSLRVWQLGGKQVRQLNQHLKGVSSATLSPDLTRLVSAGADGTLFVWDTADWALLTDLHTGEINLPSLLQSQIRAVRFSPDGTRLATSQGRTVRTWETAPPLPRHEAMLAARSVMGLVDSLFTDLGVPTAVLQNLRNNRDISGKIREAAIQTVKAASSNPALLADQAWKILMDGSSTPVAFANALELASLAHDLRPEDLGYRSAVAAAKYRTGSLDKAEADLEALMEERWDNQADPRPEGPIFLAMTHFALGHVEEAREELENLRDSMRRPLWQSRAGVLYAEALELVAEGE